MSTTPGGHGLGVRFAPPDVRTWPYPHARALPFLTPRDIDLRARMQPVGDQGQLGSCTGWAGTAALEAKLGDGQQRSPLYVYYYDRQEDGMRPDRDSGATMLGLCKALKDYGAPPEEAWYYTNSFVVEPTTQAQALAAHIDAYYQIQGTGMALLQGLWAALEAGETPMIALNIYPSFEQVGRDGKVRMPTPGEQVLGAHAMAACIWFNDNSAPGGYGWVGCQQSWGLGFADEGYVYLPAAYFTSGIVREGWVLAVTAPAPPPPPPEPPVDDRTQRMKELTIQARELVLQAQQDRCAYGATRAVYQASMAQIMDHDIGPIMDVMNQLDVLIDAEPAPPQPGAQFVSPIPNGAVYGKTKWLPGSLGADFFVPRGTHVVAPADCVVEEVIGGQGISGGAELILSLPDKSWAWRYRHVQAVQGVAVGVRVPQGTTVAYVLDTSLAQLGNPPAWSQPMPDGYQHLDLSVNRGTDQFSPQGGGGGNVDADAWMESLGYQGRVLSRTPGPTDAGFLFADAIQMMGRRG